MLKRTVAIGFCVLLASVSSAQIAFIKGRGLYVLPLGQKARPILVTKLWPLVGDDYESINWTPTGQIAITHHVDAWNGPARFGLPKTHPVCRIWVVSPRSHAQLRPIVEGDWPHFSPDGKKVAYLRTRYGKTTFMEEAFLTDLTSHREASLGPAEDTPEWVGGSSQLVLVKTNGDEQSLDLIASDTRTLVRSYGPVGLAIDLMASPDGKWLAVHNHMSRPLTGHVVLNLTDGMYLDLPRPRRFAPSIVEDWAPDGKSMACSWRVEDPRNDGSWTKEYCAVTEWPSGKGKLLRLGVSPRFSADGRGVLFMSGSPWAKRHDLMQSNLAHPRRGAVLVRGVTAFAVMRVGGSVAGVASGPGERI